MCARVIRLTDDPRLLSEPWIERLCIPTYTIRDAARYARTPSTTVSYWHNHEGRRGPALPGKEKGEPLSYGWITALQSWFQPHMIKHTLPAVPMTGPSFSGIHSNRRAHGWLPVLPARCFSAIAM
jgi:hypothetical protein